MTLDGVKAAYFQGVADPSIIEPESYALDAAILARPGNADLQIDLKLDYKRSIEVVAQTWGVISDRGEPSKMCFQWFGKLPNALSWPCLGKTYGRTQREQCGGWSLSLKIRPPNPQLKATVCAAIRDNIAD